MEPCIKKIMISAYKYDITPHVIIGAAQFYGLYFKNAYYKEIEDGVHSSYLFIKGLLNLVVWAFADDFQ